MAGKSRQTISFQNHVKARDDKRRANMARDMDAASGTMIITPPHAARPSLDTFSYDELDAETRLVLQQRRDEIKEEIRQTAKSIVSVGEKLADVHARLANYHGGKFQAWCRYEFAWSKSTAYNFLHVYEVFGSHPNFGQLDIALSALYQLAAPSTPEAARLEVLGRAQAGEAITPNDATAVIQAHKTPAASPVAPMSDEEWDELADQGEGEPVLLTESDVLPDEPPAPYRPPTPLVITPPADGLVLGAWYEAPGNSAKYTIIGLNPSSVVLKQQDTTSPVTFPRDWVKTWQRTDAPAPQPPRPFLRGSEPPAKPVVTAAPPQPPRSLTNGMTSSESEEWYTPKLIVERVRACLGGTIELDPASCAAANEVVRAVRYFDRDTDALTQEWRADSLFLNPPYGDAISAFIEKLTAELARHSFKALILVPSRTETAWFRRLHGSPRVFFSSRIKFWGGDGSGGTPFPSALLGIGVSPELLYRHFGDIGDVYVPYRPPEVE